MLVSFLTLYALDSRGERLRVALRKLNWILTGAPLQPDHFGIRESEITRWSRPSLTQVGRTWLGDYLVDEFEKRYPRPLQPLRRERGRARRLSAARSPSGFGGLTGLGGVTGP